MIQPKSAFDRLGSGIADEVSFEGLAMRYRRMARDYASIARLALADMALWDGQGHGSTETFWRQVIDLEQKREGVRVGPIGDLLNAIETGGEDTERLVSMSDRFSDERGLNPDIARTVLRSELLRQSVIDAVTKLRRDVYHGGDATDDAPIDLDQMMEAKILFRRAVELDRR